MGPGLDVGQGSVSCGTHESSEVLRAADGAVDSSGQQNKELHLLGFGQEIPAAPQIKMTRRSRTSFTQQCAEVRSHRGPSGREHYLSEKHQMEQQELIHHWFQLIQHKSSASLDLETSKRFSTGRGLCAVVMETDDGQPVGFTLATRNGHDEN